MVSSDESCVLLFDACDRFFSIPELVNLFLEQCSTKVLLNCTLVCCDWEYNIRRSKLLQEHLFLEPDGTPRSETRLNPILESHFSPILCHHQADTNLSSGAAIARLEAGRNCVAEDLTSTSWARGTSLDAPTRLAFIHDEASWRQMLVSQPPISRIDWWHEWAVDSSVAGDIKSWVARTIFNQDNLAACGWGHQDQDRQYVTLGMLWDLVESRLSRGCAVRVQYFPFGKTVEDDPYATTEERNWIARGEPSCRPYASTTPRVKIATQQIWSRTPWSQAGFDMDSKQWVTMPQKRPTNNTDDGFNTLLTDCRYEDFDEPRWSRSEGVNYWRSLDGESSGHQVGL
jgi:hypothetical protein